MSQTHPDPNRRFQIALDRARADWAAADPMRAAALAGCTMEAAGVDVSFFGKPYRVTHPHGIVTPVPATAPSQPAAPRLVHPAVTIVLLHYLLTADGASPADRWIAFRELPDGLFYAQAFAGHAEALLAERFGAEQGLAAFHRAAAVLGGTRLDLADASYRFQAFPRLAVAVLLWEGDDEFPAQARMLFDAHAGHYLPTEDLSGIGDLLAHRLTRS